MKGEVMHMIAVDGQVSDITVEGARPVHGSPSDAPGSLAAADPGPEALDGTLVFRIGYDGASFSGFAEQLGDLRTVAGEVRRALETFLRRPVDLTCAGRTDAGVHAVSQYISVPARADELAIEHRRWMRAMAALFPPDIALSDVYHARPGFSARFDARSRTYTYRIVTGDAPPLLTRSVTWWHRFPLDMEAMERAAAHLVGEHDFKSFCKTASAVDKPTCRNVMSVSFERASALGEEHIAFTITGNAFLHSMVRTIVGSLVEVGSGRRSEEWLAEALAARDRRAAGPTAPARGLCFMDVSYDDGVLERCP